MCCRSCRPRARWSACSIDGRSWAPIAAGLPSSAVSPLRDRRSVLAVQLCGQDLEHLQRPLDRGVAGTRERAPDGRLDGPLALAVDRNALAREPEPHAPPVELIGLAFEHPLDLKTSTDAGKRARMHDQRR